MARWATASALERIAACPASAALPQTRDVSQAATTGHGDHEALEAATLPGVEIVQTSGGPIRVEELRYPYWCEAEICFSWDAVSGEAKRHGRLSGPRAYPAAPYSTLYGTADVVGTQEVQIGDTAVKAAFVADIKTGHPNFLPESDSWQMRALAFMAARTMGLTHALTRIISVRDGIVTHKAQKLWMPEELAQTEVELRRIYDAVNRADRKGVTVGDVVHGYHCAFCPAFASCPYMQSVLGGGRLSQLDTRDMAQAYRNLQAVKTAEKRLEAAVRAAAANEPIHLGGDEYYGKTTRGFMKFKKRKGEEAA